MLIEIESLAMSNGEILEDVTADVPEDFLEYFIPCTIEGEEIYITAEAIVSFMLKKEKLKIHK